jgi:hypothetical protein
MIYIYNIGPAPDGETLWCELRRDAMMVVLSATACRIHQNTRHAMSHCDWVYLLFLSSSASSEHPACLVCKSCVPGIQGFQTMPMKRGGAKRGRASRKSKSEERKRGRARAKRGREEEQERRKEERGI